MRRASKRRPDEDDDPEAAGRSLPAQISFREERAPGIRDQDRKNRRENYQKPGRSERHSRMEFRQNSIGNDHDLQELAAIASHRRIAKLHGSTCGGPVRPCRKIRLHVDVHTRCGAGGASWYPSACRADNPEAAPDLFTAFQQQLGLKLESAKAPVDVMVIDKLEKPSEN